MNRSIIRVIYIIILFIIKHLKPFKAYYVKSKYNKIQVKTGYFIPLRLLPCLHCLITRWVTRKPIWVTQYNPKPIAGYKSLPETQPICGLGFFGFAGLRVLAQSTHNPLRYRPTSSLFKPT